jgi:drug/metabolite transporter (DMT)-like permease
MRTNSSSHFRTVVEALFVTVLWSTSWVLIKRGWKDIPPLTCAGLRYTLALVCLLPLALRKPQRASLRQLPACTWGRLTLLGLLLYTVTQGAQFLSLAYLPAATNSLILSFTSILVALLGIGLLNERPTPIQWGGTLLYLVGIWIYFSPTSLSGGAGFGLLAAGVCLLGNALASCWDATSTAMRRSIRRPSRREHGGGAPSAHHRAAHTGAARLTIADWGLLLCWPW